MLRYRLWPLRFARRFGVACLTVLAILIRVAPAWACAVCGTGDPTLTVMGSERPFAGRFRLAGEVRVGSARVGTPGLDEVSVREQRFDVTAAYAPTPALFLSLAVPLLRREATGVDGVSKAAFGLGDVELRVKYFVWKARRGSFRHQAAIQGGVKLPTAPVQSDARGDALPAALQPGMGAVTPMAGLFYGFSHGSWSLFTSATVYLPFAVREGPHASRSLRTSVSAQRQVGRAFAARLGFNTRLDASGEAYGATDTNSGGFVGYVSPELVWSPVSDLLLHAGAHVPAIQALYGRHREGAILAVGVTYDF